MRLDIDEKRTVYIGPTNAKLLLRMQQIEGRKSWKGSKLIVETSKHNVELLSEICEEINDNRMSTKEKEKTEKIAVMFGSTALSNSDTLVFSFKTEPFDQQKDALAAIGNKKYFGLFCEQGTGKTKITIDWFCALFRAGHITGVLVVSRNGAHRQWIESEIEKHETLDSDWAGQAWPFKRLAVLDPEFSSYLHVLSFNWDSIRTKRAKGVINEFIQYHKGKLLIVADESQDMKNDDSARNKAMWEFRPYSSHRAILSGTPIAQNLVDEYVQLDWLNEDILGIKYKTTFKNRFCLLGGRNNREVVGVRNIEEFRKITAPHVFRITKEELGILPKQYSDWSFSMTNEQRGVILELKQQLLEDLNEREFMEGEIKRNPGAAALFMKMQQVSNGFIMDDERNVNRLMPLDQNPRITNLLEWSKTFDGKGLIWFRFVEDQRMISEVLSAEGIDFVSYYGATSEKDRSAAVESFNDPYGVRFFIGNPQSAGTGLNLQYGGCRKVAYYSNSFNAVDRWQSEDRVHRIGVKGIVEYTDLIARGSIDRKIALNIRTKKGISELAIGDLLADIT
jgi:hypothetical protein